jgi:hypothetical protein
MLIITKIEVSYLYNFFIIVKTSLSLLYDAVLYIKLLVL